MPEARTGWHASLRARGYAPDVTRQILRRMFVDAFRQPGLHAFWRVWNPFYGFLLHRLYVTLGGRPRPVLASMVVFVASGFVLHDLPAWALTCSFGLTVTVAFAAWGLIAARDRRRVIGTTPSTAHAARNALLLLFGLATGVAVDVGGAAACAHLSAAS